MAILRKKKQNNFTTISNIGLKDKQLSFKAKGLLTYMWSLPDDWDFYETEISKHSTDGIASVRSGLKELEERGYLVKQRVRNNNGQLGPNDWLISDEPNLEKPDLENPSLEKPSLDNRTLLNTNLTNNLNKPITNNKPSSTELKERFESIWKLYPRKEGKSVAFKHYQKALQEDEELTDEAIVKGLENYVAYLKQEKTEKTYMKMGETWFSKRSWQDEYAIKNTAPADDRYDLKHLTGRSVPSGRSATDIGEDDAAYEDDLPF